MSSDYVMCHTYQAFCVAVLDIVRQLDDFNSETQRLIKSGGQFTLHPFDLLSTPLSSDKPALFLRSTGYCTDGFTEI